jgi:hypothetical protein
MVTPDNRQPFYADSNSLGDSRPWVLFHRVTASLRLAQTCVFLRQTEQITTYSRIIGSTYLTSGNLHLRNQQIRDYCTANGKVLYDFYDIELYDPDGNYYGDKSVNDNCDYDSDGNGSLDANWAIDWQNSHIENVDWYNCPSAHSQPLNANRKAYAAWWLWARIAGWEPKKCKGDFDEDGDVDGDDLFKLTQDEKEVQLKRFAEEFGRIDCK